MVDFPTRGDNMLDILLVTDSHLVDSVTKKPPFGSSGTPSDHDAFLFDTKILITDEKTSFKFRNFRAAKWPIIERCLLEVNWEDFFACSPHVHHMVRIFTDY